MSKRHVAVFPVACFLSAVGGAFAVSGASQPPPERLVAATIRVDGEVLLRARTSDDGRPDADAVWGYLLTHLEFRPTGAYATLGIGAEVEAVSLGWLKGKANEHRGVPPSLELDVAYGGTDKPFRLGLLRVEGSDTWRVDRETVERRFPYRKITRREAALLTDPRREK